MVKRTLSLKLNLVNSRERDCALEKSALEAPRKLEEGGASLLNPFRGEL